MAKMDPQWALSEIDKFLALTARVVPDMGPGIAYFGTVMTGSKTDAAAQAHVVEQILDRVLPGWSRDRPNKDKEFSWLREQASRGKGALDRQAELAEKLGDNAPGMDASNLHPWVWDAARSLWNSGHYQQAVMQSAIRVNVEAQAKSGRVDIAETDLFNQLFKADAPKEGAPRFRLRPDDGSKTYSSVQRGAMAFAEGLYAGIRNPGMHTPAPADGGEEQLALEQLAAFSILARWVDQAMVRTV